MKLPKQLWMASDYAVTFCTELANRPLKRKTYWKKTTDKEISYRIVRFYCAKTRKKLFECNDVFAKYQFRKIKNVKN